MLGASNICKSYNGERVLCDVDFYCDSAQVISLLGANSSGKTTLLQILSGLTKPDSGSAKLNFDFGYSPQKHFFLQEMTVLDILSLYYASKNISRKNIFSAGSAEHFLGLYEYRKKLFSKLSGGIKRKTSIAAACAGECSILLFDEPFSSLDNDSTALVCSLFSRLKQQKKLLIFSSHILTPVYEIADRLLFLSGGVLLSDITLDKDRAVRICEIDKCMKGN